MQRGGRGDDDLASRGLIRRQVADWVGPGLISTPDRRIARRGFYSTFKSAPILEQRKPLVE